MLVVEDIVSPVAGRGEVVVAIKATALNFFDTLIIENKYQFKPDMPFSPGAEIAGEILAIGEGVSGFHRPAILWLTCPGAGAGKKWR